MKRAHVLGAAMILMAGLGGSAQAAELLTNGGFEDGYAQVETSYPRSGGDVLKIGNYDACADALRISSAVVASVSADAQRPSAGPTLRRILALSLQRRGMILHRVGSFAAACATERRALSGLTATRPAPVALSMDTAPDGPIARLRSAIAGDCRR